MRATAAAEATRSIADAKNELELPGGASPEPPFGPAWPISFPCPWTTSMSQAPPLSAPPDALAFYAECLALLARVRLPYLLGGTHAVNAHTGMERPVKDLDVFCRAGDYPRILTQFQERGYEIEVEDERWLAKVRQGPHFTDLIFNSTSGVAPVTDRWFEEARTVTVYGLEVPIVPPTELVWSKLFVQDRQRYDGADIAHVILRQCDSIDWRRLLGYTEQFWEVLLAHLINFRFIYPTERERIPRWLMDELLGRVQAQENLPAPLMKVCRGRHFSRGDYQVDLAEWGFADIVGEGERTDASPAAAG